MRKIKKTQIRKRSTTESRSAAKAFNDPQLLVLTEDDPALRVMVPGRYRTCRGATGGTCGGLGQGRPRVLRGGEVNDGRTRGRPNRAGGCLAVTEPRDIDQVRGGRGVPNQVEVQGREDRNESMTFPLWRPYRTVIQEDSAIPGTQSHWGHYCDDNPRLRPTH